MFAPYGGVAQMARACGSYPQGRWFKSDRRYQFGPLVKRLRHRPFTAESGVQFPYGSPTREFSSAGRASALQAEGHRFEPCNSHQFITHGVNKEKTPSAGGVFFFVHSRLRGPGRVPGRFFATYSFRGSKSQKTLPRLDLLRRQKGFFRQLHLPFAFLFAIRHPFLLKEHLEGAKSCDFECRQAGW